MRPLLAAALGMLCATGVLAQQVRGEVRNLDSALPNLAFKIEDLMFKVEDMTYRVDDLIFRVEDLGGAVRSLQVRETATEVRIELPADILFDFDKSDIRPAAEPALKQAADVIRKSARGTVLIEGHTDAKGSAAYNQKLSERRATSVRTWLTKREGLDKVRFATKGLGASRPVAPNARPDGADDPVGRQKNRRVEIVFGRK